MRLAAKESTTEAHDGQNRYLRQLPLRNVNRSRAVIVVTPESFSLVTELIPGSCFTE